MKKRLLSAALAVCMIFGSAAALPEGVFSESTSITASAETSKATSGKCGENVSWSLKNGVVTISGKGDMYDYQGSYYGSPFFGRNDIKSVVIKSGVTNISYAAFSECKNLSKVTLPSTVKSIVEGAFCHCSSLKTITIPNGVSNIGIHAFSDCNSLESVTLPNSITSISPWSFMYCSSLKSITIPDSVTDIGPFAFMYCLKLENVSIPSSVKSIGESEFFNCTSLKSVMIPKSVTKIEENAFGYYEDEKDGNIIKKVSDFKIYCYKGTAGEKYAKDNGFAFEYLSKDYDFTQLADGTIELYSYNGKDTNVTVPSTFGGNKVSAIGNYTFSFRPKIKSITIPSSVTRIGLAAFEYCISLTSVNIPDSVTSIDLCAFLGCNRLTSLTIPKSVTSIGENAFSDCDKLTIKCYKDSAAEKYAKENKIKYTLIRNPEPKATRLAGANRYETASVISTKMYPKTSGTVIIATGLTFHDAMVAVPLASAYNAPLLLATEKHITAQTEAELKRLKAKNVIVVSTNGAIGAKAKAEFKAAKYNMTYIEGKTCFETAAKVAKALQTKTKKAPTTIFFATNGAFADALSASPIAAIKGAPILYLKNKGSIDTATANYLKSVKGKVKNVYIIGGDGVISNAMMKNVANALGLTVNKTVVRVAGKNRYETCTAVNNKFKSVLTGDGICVAKGLDFPDALAGGVYAASTKQALFLADGKKLQDCQNSYLKTKNVAKITVFGGTGAVPDDLVKLIAKTSV